MLVKVIAFIALFYITTIECEIKKDERQLMQDLDTVVQLFGRLNSDLELKKPDRFQFEENIESWAFDDDTTAQAIKIYIPSNNTLSPSFNCKPNITSCYNLKIKNLTKELTGIYQRKSESVDLKTNTIVRYYVYGYEMLVKCNMRHDHHGCSYNENTNTLTVKENQNVVITCITNVHGHKKDEEEDDEDNKIPALELSVEHRFNDSNKCKDDDNDYDDVDVRADQIVVHKTCQKSFKRSDKLYICALRNASEQLDRMHRLDLGKIDIKLNITYRPEKNETEFSNLKLNISMAQSNPVTLTCPYHGNPIFYEWRLIKNNTKVKDLSNNKSYTIKDIGPGLHEIECRISVPGDTKSFNSTKFSVNITRSGSVSTANTVHLSYILSGLLVFTIFIQAWLS